MNFSNMDLQAKLTEIKAERAECVATEEKAHARIIEIDRQARSLTRLLKEAEEIFAPKTAVEDLEEVTKNL